MPSGKRSPQPRFWNVPRIFLGIVLGIMVLWAVNRYTGGLRFTGKTLQETGQSLQKKAQAEKEEVAQTLAEKKKAIGETFSAQSQEPDPTEDPDFFYPEPGSSDELITHKAFVCSYIEVAEQPRWVAYVLKKQHLSGGAKRENDQFQPDKKVSTGSAHPLDYKGSGYDRGHLCPSADRSFSEALQAETFLMSNISPQAPECNRGIWRDIEEQVRTWARESGKLYIVTGPYLRRGAKTIGRNEVQVPEAFFKVVLDWKNRRMIGFWVPNSDSILSPSDLVVSVDEIEEKTGTDFYPELPDELEESLECCNQASEWF